MKHNLKIQYEDIMLRPMASEDSELYRIIRNKPEIRGYFFNRGEITEEQQRQWYASYLTKPGDYMFSIIDIRGEFIGGCGIYGEDKNGMRAEFGRIAITPIGKWGGYGTKATLAAIRLAQELIGLKELYLFVKKDNSSALAVYTKAGYRVTGNDDGVIQMTLAF